MHHSLTLRRNTRINDIEVACEVTVSLSSDGPSPEHVNLEEAAISALKRLEATPTAQIQVQK